MFLILLMIVAVSITSISPPTDESQIEVTRLSDKAIVLKIGKEYITNVTALSTSKGIVVIDTNYIPSLAEKLREKIEQELQRNDFAYVINTHGHRDHTHGNQFFSETKIIGHENCVAAMREFEKELPDFIEQRKKWTETVEKELAKLEPDSPQARWMAEVIANQKSLIPELEQGKLVATPPDLTFNDRLTLFLGGMTLDLFFSSGNVHSDSDIFIRVPEEGFLFVGDLHAKRWLPFINPASDVPLWLKQLDEILEDGSAIRHVITGHHELMTVEDLRTDRDYVKTIWEEVAAARGEGKSLEETKTHLSFESRFSHLEGLIHVWQGNDYHVSNIETVWRMQEK